MTTPPEHQPDGPDGLPPAVGPDHAGHADPPPPPAEPTSADEDALADQDAQRDVVGPVPPPARASLATRIVLGVTVLALVAAVVWDVRREPVASDPLLASDAVPVAGATTCAALGVEGGGEVVAATLLAPAEDEADDGAAADGAAADGDAGTGAAGTAEPAAASVHVVDGDDVDVVATLETPGAVETLPVEVPDEGLVTARWEGSPVVLARRITAATDARVQGSVAGPCAGGAAGRWLVPGVATAGGASATLHLANPTGAAASVQVEFTTPEGRVAPTRLGNVVVPAGERRVVDLNEFVPEQPDLGIDVVARSGAVVVEAVQQLEAAVGDVDGRSLVAAVTAPSEVWTVPWVDGRDRASPWLWVTNPGDRSADVRLVVHGPDGPVVPPGAGTSLGPGTTQRIDLRGVLAGAVAGVTVRSSEGQPIVVSGTVVRSPAGGSSQGTADAGAPDADEEATTDDDLDVADLLEDEPPDTARGGIAVVAGLPAVGGTTGLVLELPGGRNRQLWLANPGEDQAVAEATVIDSSGAATALGGTVAVPAGGSTVLPLEGVPAGPAAVLVEVTDGALVGTLVTWNRRGSLDLTAQPLQPLTGAPVTVLDRIRRDRTLLHPIDLGSDPAGPSSDPTVDPGGTEGASPAPAPTTTSPTPTTTSPTPSGTSPTPAGTSPTPAGTSPAPSPTATSPPPTPSATDDG